MCTAASESDCCEMALLCLLVGVREGRVRLACAHGTPSLSSGGQPGRAPSASSQFAGLAGLLPSLSLGMCR